MANKKLQATAQLFLNTKDAQKDAKLFVEDLKQKLRDIESAADKMTVFKDMVSYIAQVDKALAALRKNNKEAFNSMFDGLDFNLKQQLEGLFGVNGSQLGQVDALREKLNTLTLKSSIKEIRTFAKEINTLFTSIGVSAPFDNIDEQFSGRTNTTHIQALATALANFATVWEDLSANIAKGLGVGGQGAGISGMLVEQNKAVQEEVEKLKKQKEEYQELIDAFSGKNIKVKTTKKTDVTQLQELINKFNEAQAVVQQFENANNTSGDAYKKAVAEAVKMATLLKNTMDYVSEYGSDEGNLFVSSNTGKNDPYGVAEAYLNRIKNSNLFNDVQTYLNQQIQHIDGQIGKVQSHTNPKQTILSYNTLEQKLKAIHTAMLRLDDFTFGSDEYTKAEKAVQDLIDDFNQLYVAQDKIDDVNDIFNNIGAYDFGDEDYNTAFDELRQILQIEIPQAVNQAENNVDTFGKKIINVSEYVSALSGQLKEMFAAAGRSANFEYHIAIDGLDIKARHGSEKSVDLATQTETYLDTLFSDSVLYGHSHRGGTSATNIQDIESVLSSYRDGVAIPVHFVVGKDSITTMDFTGLSKDVTDQLMQEIAATNSNKNAPVINDNINKIVEKFTGKSDALKTWNSEQFDDLAKYIYDISSAASSVLTPIEKFQAVLDNMFGKGKIDASKYESLLSVLDKDNVKSIFNQIASMENLQPINTTDMLTMGQVNAEIDESIAKYKALREEANLSYSDIRNEVDKVIEHYKSGGSATSGLDFFQQYFPEGEWQNVRNLLTEAYDNLISIEEVTNRIANEFAVDPDTFAQIPNGTQSSQIVDETNQKLREQEQLWENVKIAIKNGIGEAVGLDNTAMTLEVIEREIKEGILTSLEECISRFKEFNNISEDGSLIFVRDDEHVIPDYYDTYISGYDEVVSKEEADKLRQLSIQQEQLYQNLRSAIKGTLTDVVDVDDMTYVFDTIEKDIQSGLLTTLDQCIERFKLLTGLDDKRLTDIRDGQRVSDEWDYYQGDASSYDVQAAEDAALAAQLRAEEAESDALRYQEAANRLLDEKSELQRENDELREQLSTQIDADHKSQLAQAEISQLELLQQKLLEVKAAVDTKTQAFEEEYVTVDGVVDSEIVSLQSLITQLQEVVAQVNLVGDAFNNINTNIPKIEIDDKLVGQNSTHAENTHYVTDPQGRPVTMYRGIRNSYSGLVSNRYHGGTFSTDNLELAKEYAGELGKVEKVLLSMKNPLEIDGHGAFWNKIEYIGDNADEASQKLYELNASIRATEKLLKKAEQIPVSDQELRNINRGFITEDDTKRAREISYWTKELKKHQEEKAAIIADTSNPYGKKNTNELVEIAKAKGYDGVIFKNIIDSATGDVKDLSNVMVTFEQDQIHYIETIASTFESSITELKNYFGDLTQHISASGEEVEASIRKMVELRGKLNAGEISEDEYSAFISGNAIARDYEKLAKRSMAVPDFITGALDGEEFDLKHVIQMINDMLDNMRHRTQKIAKAFGKEDVPLDQLLTSETNVKPIVESTADETNVTDEIGQLDKLQSVLSEVKNAVLAKTKAFVDESNVVGQVVGKEIAALIKLSEIVDGIVPKVNSLADGLKNIKKHSVDIKDQNTNKTGSDDQTTDSIKDASPKDSFSGVLRNQKNAFNEYREGLQNVDYMSAELRDELDQLAIKLQQVTDTDGLKQFQTEFNALQDTVAAKKAAFDKRNFGYINSAENNLVNSFNSLTLKQQLIVDKEYRTALDTLEQYRGSVKNGKDLELKAIYDVVSALRQKLETYKEVNREAKKTATLKNENASFGSTATINATAKYNSLSKMAKSEQFAGSSEVSNAFAQYDQIYKRVIERQNELRNSGKKITDLDKEAFKELTTECNNYAKALEKIINSSLKLKSKKVNPGDYMLGDDFVDDKEGRTAALTDFVQKMYGVQVAAEDFKDVCNKVVFAVDNGDGTFTQMTATFTEARNEIVALAGDTKKTQGKFESFIDGVKGRLQSLSQYFIATVGIYDVWNVIKQGINHVREIDSALTELKKVTDETDASYKQFLQDMSKTGSVIGATVKDLTTMASEWARLGYSLEESAKLAESTAILLNVSEFKDATEASEALISTMQAFQYTADESQHVVDVLNEVGNNYAVSSDGIATALQDSASALMEGGNNLEQAVALVAAANRVVQDPNSVGSALRTISLRLRGTSVEVLEEMGEETDGVAESASKLQEKLKALTGVDIVDMNGAYKDTYTILKEIGSVWEDMNDMDQAATLELMAGKNRANTLSAILSNMTDLEGAYNDALNAEGKLHCLNVQKCA